MNELIQTAAPETVPLNEQAFSKTMDTAVTWLGGASFLVNARGLIILIDPVLTIIPDNPMINEIGLKMRASHPIEAMNIPRVDIVLYTHIDDDHLGPETAKVLMKHQPIFIGPPPVFEVLAKLGADPERVRVFRNGDTYNSETTTITFVPADHPWQLLDPAKFGRPFRSGDCCGFVVETLDARCYFPGDTRLMEEHLALKDIDILALDSSVCTYHLNHFNAVSLVNTLNKALLIPFHYGTYDAPESLALNGDPMDIIRNSKDGASRLRNLSPGGSVHMFEKQEIK